MECTDHGSSVVVHVPLIEQAAVALNVPIDPYCCAVWGTEALQVGPALARGAVSKPHYELSDQANERLDQIDEQDHHGGIEHGRSGEQRSRNVRRKIRSPTRGRSVLMLRDALIVNGVDVTLEDAGEALGSVIREQKSTLVVTARPCTLR